MHAPRKIQLGCLLLAVVMAVVGSMHQDSINEKRRALEIGLHDKANESLPLSLRFAVTSLGTFRAFAIDYLWIKAVKYKEENKHYLSLQHAKWICALQPRFAKVWTFQSWEMAFNISVNTHTPEERWNWVHNGIKLLRDEAIPINPGTLELYKELGWIYFFKIGDVMDEMHWVYKREWAALMHRVVGAPQPGAGTRETIDAFRPIAEAPQDLEALIASDPRVGDYVQQLESTGIGLGYPLLDALASTEPTAILDLVPDTEATLPQATTLPDDGAEGAVRNRLVAFVQADILRKEFKLDATWMLELMETYGPLDWRSPFSHTLYWTTLATRDAFAFRKDIEALNNDRFMQFGLNRLIHSGRLTFRLDPEHPNQSDYNEAPDIRFIEPLHQAYIEMGKKKTGGEGLDKNVETQAKYFANGHRGFLEDAVRLLYRYGTDAQLQQAREYYRYLRTNFKMPNGDPMPQYLLPFDEFAIHGLFQDIDRMKIATSTINAELEQSFAYLSMGDLDLYQGQQRMARRMYETFMKRRGKDPSDRMKLPPWETMLANTLSRFMTLPAVQLSSVRPPRGVSPQSETARQIYILQAKQAIVPKARVWRHLSTLGDVERVNEANRKLRQRVYDEMLPVVAAQCELAGLDVDKAFPEPVGMAAFREQRKSSEQPPTQTQPTAAVP
jgi:hypothetical protein